MTKYENNLINLQVFLGTQKCDNSHKHTLFMSVATMCLVLVGLSYALQSVETFHVIKYNFNIAANIVPSKIVI